MYKYIQIKGYDGEIIKHVDVSKYGDREIDKIDGGMNRNLNHEKYYTFSFESEKEIPDPTKPPIKPIDYETIYR